MVEPGRYSQRHTALTLSERWRKSGLYRANRGAGPGPSGSTRKHSVGPVLQTESAGAPRAMVEPLARPYVLKATVWGACSSLKPRSAPGITNGCAYSWKLRVG